MSKRDLTVGKIEDLGTVRSNLYSLVPHPLYVGISQTDALKLNNTEDEFTGMITLLSPTKERRKLFVSALVINVKSESSANSVTLFVNRVFLQHYNLQVGINVYFKTVYVLPLDKVVIGVNAAVYDRMKSQEWATGLLLSVCENKLLIRAKDAWLANLSSHDIRNRLTDAVVLGSYPLSQGILNVRTNIIVIRTDNKDKLLNYSLVKQASTLDIKRTVSLFFYTFPYVSHQMQYKSLVATNFKVEIFPQPPAVLKFGIKFEDETYDFSGSVFLSKACMYSRKLLEGSWGKIRLLSSVEAKKLDSERTLSNDNCSDCGRSITSGKYRFTRIFSLDEWLCEGTKNLPKSNVAFISPSLWFNMNDHPSPLLQNTAEISIEPLSSEFKIPYASEVYISLVQSPEINTVFDCDVLRRNYFKTPRVVCTGDVLAISSHVDAAFNEKMGEASNAQSPVVYFKVSSIISPESSSCFLVDNDHCSIYQAGTKQSYIPATMDAYYSPFSIHPLWEVPRPAGIDTYVEQLQCIVAPYLKLGNTSHQINPHILLMGDSGCGKTTIVKALCRCLNLHLYMVNCYDLVGGIPGSSEARIKTVFEKATMYAPCVLLLRNVEAIGRIKDDEDPRVFNLFVENLKKVNENTGDWPVIVIATGMKSQLQNTDLFAIMLHHVNVEVPSEEQRKLILNALFSTSQLASDVCLSYVAKRTVGFVLGDLTALFAKTLMISYNRLKQRIMELALTWKEEMDISYAGILISQNDIINSLEELQSVHAQMIGTPMIPNVRWEDVGGLNEVKQEILDTIQLPLEHPELLNAGLRRSGILLYGPPGTGKTLLAKAVATECSLNFLSVKGPELINMYVGQSEENVREVFRCARSVSPCVIFFDELDSLAPNRGRSGDSGGVMDRVVSQLLAELDGLNKSAEVFVIGATNRPDLLDPALLRPGRFDRLVYVGISEDRDSRIKILKALTYKMPLAKEVSLHEIEKRCPLNLSGADLYSLCSDALMSAIGRCVYQIENGEPEKDVQLTVTQEDFDVAVKTVVPSVSPEELRRFAEIKRNFIS